MHKAWRELTRNKYARPCRSSEPPDAAERPGILCNGRTSITLGVGVLRPLRMSVAHSPSAVVTPSFPRVTRSTTVHSTFAWQRSAPNQSGRTSARDGGLEPPQPRRSEAVFVPRGSHASRRSASFAQRHSATLRARFGYAALNGRTPCSS